MDYKAFISGLAHKLDCDTTTAGKLVDGFVAIVREETANANRVALPGFGTFEGVKHEEEIISDLATGKRMLLPPSIELTFVPGGMLKKKLKSDRK